MTKNAIFLSLVFAFLFLGCLGAGEAEEGPSGAPPSGGGQPPAEEGQPPAEEGQPPAEEQPPADGGVDFTGLDYAAILALGVPVECDITIFENGEQSTIKFYAKGEGEMRQEYTQKATEGYECSKFVWINKANDIYLCCEGGDLLPNSTCDCLFFECKEGEEPTEAGAAEGYSAPGLAGVPSTQISCRPWLYDPSKFQAAGRVCTMDEYIQEMMQAAYDY